MHSLPALVVVAYFPIKIHVLIIEVENFLGLRSVQLVTSNKPKCVLTPNDLATVW